MEVRREGWDLVGGENNTVTFAAASTNGLRTVDMLGVSGFSC